MVFAKKQQKGFTLIEIIISIMLAVILVLIINTLLVSKTLSDRGENSTLAYALAQEEMEKLLNRGVLNLTNTTSAKFIDILFHEGEHAVLEDVLSYSAPKVLNLTSDTALTTTVTGAIVAPKNLYDSITVDARLMLRSGSPLGSGKGIFFRAQDKKNGYLLTVSDTAIRLIKLVGGVETTLYSSAYFIVFDAWDRFELTVSGNILDFRLNGVSQFNITDDTFMEGYLAFVVTNGGDAAFDDITITDAVESASYTFDSLTAGELRGEWQRQSLKDLPQGTGEIDIANYLGDENIKDITVRTGWNEKGSLKTMELKTLITK